jgi:transcription-repair coupling factor (superfamily II helicase)
VLRRLAQPSATVVLIGTVEALIWRVPVPRIMQASAWRFAVGHLDESAVRVFLLGRRYVVDEGVEGPGATQFLGHALEIFPAGALGPIRIGTDAGAPASMRIGSTTSETPTHCRTSSSMRSASGRTVTISPTTHHKKPAWRSSITCRRPGRSTITGVAARADQLFKRTNEQPGGE